MSSDGATQTAKIREYYGKKGMCVAMARVGNSLSYKNLDKYLSQGCDLKLLFYGPEYAHIETVLSIHTEDPNNPYIKTFTNGEGISVVKGGTDGNFSHTNYDTGKDALTYPDGSPIFPPDGTKVLAMMVCPQPCPFK